jgi:VanZ family protein
VAFATLCPVELRPHVSTPDLERFTTFVALGLIFGFAYARKKGLWLALSIVVGSALGLELLQLIDPSRDGRVADALFKAIGGALGAATGHLVRLMLERRRLA